MGLVCVVVFVAWAFGCGFPRPTPFGGMDATDDDDGGVSTSPVCTANQTLRCEGSNLVRCNSDGTAEIKESCAVRCSTSELRCEDVKPSNGLAPYLDMTAGEPDANLGTAATINTDDGTILVDGKPVALNNTPVTQPGAPTIRVFIVHSLTTGDVTIRGSNALAIVSAGELKVGGIMAASAAFGTPGAGGFNENTCQGADGVQFNSSVFGGSGGGGFGAAGGGGGASVFSSSVSALGGAGGRPAGNATLVPLRGGCNGGNFNTPFGLAKGGAGGGAIQLVSRTRIAVSGAVAANGSSAIGGGSGGGILLEAPVVEVSGSVVANGGGGANGCGLLAIVEGADGRLDATPASGSTAPCSSSGVNGGNGGAGNIPAGGGPNNLSPPSTGGMFAGHGGGGVGRIRVNTVSGGLQVTGLFSPNPTTGTIASR